MTGSTKALETAAFIAKQLGIRWGGDFSSPDPIHFDYPFGNKPTASY